MSVVVDAAQLSDLITQLFQGQNVVKVNEAILNFTLLKSCWQVSLSLLQSPVSYIRFFVANMVYSKIRKDSSQLSDIEKREVLLFLLELLKNNVNEGNDISSDTLVFRNRLVLCLISISFRIPNGMTVYFNSSREFIAAGLVSNNVVAVSIGLRMLSPLSEELEAADVSSSLRNELQSSLTDQVDNLLNILVESCQFGSTVGVLILQVCRAWCNFGISLSKLYNGYRAVYQQICASLMSSDLSEVVECWSLVGELITVTEYPKPAYRDEIIESLLKLISQRCSSNILVDSSISTALCNCLVSIASAELSVFVTIDPSASSFFGLLLSVVQLSPRSLIMLTFDLWIEVQDTPYDDLHPLVKSEVIPSLLRVIISHCVYTSAIEADDDDKEDWEQLRDPRLGISELLSVCQFGMRNAFFHSLFQCLPVGLCADDMSLCQLEAVLFIVTNLDSLKSTLESRDFNGILDLPLILSLLFEMTSRCLQQSEIQLLSVNPFTVAIFKEAVVRFIGSVTFLLTKNTAQSFGREIKSIAGSTIDFSQLFLPCVHLLITNVGSSTKKVATAASKSFHQLCVHGIKWLTLPATDAQAVTAFPTLLQLIVVYDQYIKEGGCCEESLLLLTESLVRCVVAISADQYINQRALLGKLCEPVLSCLVNECSSGTFVATKVNGMLCLISQIIRFCDVPVVNNDHILVPILQQVWPLLELIGNSPLSGEPNDSASVMSTIFEIFGRVFSSLSILAVGQSQQVVGLILIVLRSHSPCSSSALKCASVLVELFVTKINKESNSTTESSLFLSYMLENIVAEFHGNVVNGLPSFNNDLECIEAFYSLIYNYMIFCPSVLFVSNHNVLNDVLNLTVLTLGTCSEREPLRNVFQVLQCGFCPPALKAHVSIQQTIVQQFLLFGETIVCLLLSQVSKGVLVLSLAPALSDVLLAIISSTLDGSLSVCQSWFHKVIVVDNNLFNRLENVENRLLLFNLLFHFARTNSRRFKVLIQDLFKICSSELSVDSLMAYSDVLA